MHRNTISIPSAVAPERRIEIKGGAYKQTDAIRHRYKVKHKKRNKEIHITYMPRHLRQVSLEPKNTCTHTDINTEIHRSSHGHPKYQQ